ncbi:RING-H2 finger protein ATL52-like [Zingiber officinale]|uniref:RING-type E3 ubiquitin transferase n=1 Tax=Zingiber officinale TaxID=94328 RepID=A0A8J5I4U0_ZINOF|nr:RING-H2 finger protein ATL52-like [Zingiber officinale]KAG6535674.1 hypothetical protein ZIOFF_000697 [Zingiber officinale]
MGPPGFKKCSSPIGCSAANGAVSSRVDSIFLMLFAFSAAVVALYLAYFVSRLVLRVLRLYLAKAAIGAISATEFKASDGSFLDGADFAVDCVVCLSEIRDGELVRVLPKCRHVFHVPCIDPWLKFHANCPICRANLAGDAANDDDVDVESGASAVSLAPAGNGEMENGVGTGMNSTQAIDPPSIETSAFIEIDVR